MRNRVVVLVSAGAAVALAGAGVLTWVVTRPPAVDVAALPSEPLAVDASVVLTEQVTIADPGGCPPVTVAAPAPPEGGAAVMVPLGPDTWFTHACLGPADGPLGTRLPVAEPGEPPFRLTRVPSPVGDLVRVDGGPLHGRLTDWHVDHDGYQYVFGFLRPVSDESRRGVAEAMLASLTWTTAPAS